MPSVANEAKQVKTFRQTLNSGLACTIYLQTQMPFYPFQLMVLIARLGEKKYIIVTKSQVVSV